MATTKALEIPELFPKPKVLTKLEGASDLSLDVRLVTNNVFPLQRKAIRSILCDTGVRVVANKKKYVMEIRVESSECFDLSGVPSDVQSDYYELKIEGSEMLIRAPYQNGTVWGSQTAATLFKMLQAGKTLPNMLIKDWPVLPVRGVFIESKWGPDRMTTADWFKVIDQLSALKLNTLGIGLYGCWCSCRYEDGQHPAEFLMARVPKHDDVKSQHRLTWYSPEKDAWKKENYVPAMFEDETILSDVIGYASERGMAVIPFVNSLGHNTLLPRMIPEISAKDENGKPKGIGYCLSSSKTKSFLTSFYGGILEKYYPKGADYFHIQLDEVWPDICSVTDPTQLGDPWCSCSACRKHSHEENLQEYILWLVGMLVEKGVKKVVLWNDQLTRHSQLLGAAFAKRLEEAGLKDRIILHWWCYNNETIEATRHPALGRKLGIEGWVAPMTCYFNWSTYDYHLPNIDLMLKMGEKEGARGAVSYSVHDPSHLDHEALLAAYAWESSKGQKAELVLKRWALRFGEDADKYLKATGYLREVAASDFYNACLCYQYTYSKLSGTESRWPREYPGEALVKLEAMDGADEGLAAASAAAKKALELLSEMLSREGLGDQEQQCLNSLKADALRMVGVADAFLWLLTLRKELVPGMVMKRMSTAALKAKDDLVAVMAGIENSKPVYVMPAVMHGMSILLSFFNQLIEELKKHAARKQANQIHWGCRA